MSKLTSEQEKAIGKVESALKELYASGLVMITDNGNAVFYTKENYENNVKIVEIFKNKKLQQSWTWWDYLKFKREKQCQKNKKQK